MTNIKLIASDLDGTLLDDEKKISRENFEALKRAIDGGVIFAPATGRSLTSTPREVLNMFGVKYVICANGAFVKDLTLDKVIYERLLEKELIFKVMDIAGEREDVILDIFSGGKAVTEDKSFRKLEGFDMPGALRQYISDSRYRVRDLREYLEECEYRVEKIHFLFKNLKIRAEYMKILKALDDAVVTSALALNAEINSLGTTKGAALEFLCGYLNIDIKNVIAFGDGDNDIQMLQAAGLGVAMANADPEVKEAADRITSSNLENGVAAILNEYF
jgi:Cof subfamily protein (haloacid dehalogenase superfamily)